MKRTLVTWSSAAFLAFLVACSSSDQRTANDRAAAARERARHDAEQAGQALRKLGSQATRKAKELNQDAQNAVQGDQSGSPSNADPGQKLDHAGQELHAAAQRAAVKLDRATLMAKVKAKLATDVGLSAASSIDVDVSGDTVTLRGTVSSEDKKHEAEQAVQQVPGVAKVTDLLAVQS